MIENGVRFCRGLGTAKAGEWGMTASIGHTKEKRIYSMKYSYIYQQKHTVQGYIFI